MFSNLSLPGPDRDSITSAGTMDSNCNIEESKVVFFFFARVQIDGWYRTFRKISMIIFMLPMGISTLGLCHNILCFLRYSSGGLHSYPQKTKSSRENNINGAFIHS
jgi:hypothetical protein